MKCQIIWYDDEGNASRIDEAYDVSLRENNPIKTLPFGMEYVPQREIVLYLTLTLMNPKGKPNYITRIVHRKTDANMKFIETKRDFKKREREQLRRLVKR